MEMLMTLVKGLPTGLAAAAEIIIVALIFMAAVTFLAGVWLGFCIVRKKARYITKFTLVPLTLEFKPTPDKVESKDDKNGEETN